MRRDIFKDKNLKLSSKRIIAFVCLVWAMILSIPCFFLNIGDEKIIYAFLWVAGGGTLSSLMEHLFKN